MIALVRHGETEWTITGQHTSRTDVPLTDEGRRQAAALTTTLARRHFALVLSSPMQRALETCRLAGFGDHVEISDDLVEWDYGTYEGRTTEDIRANEPGWTLWEGSPELGESIAAITSRADRVIARIDDVAGNALVFSHGHFLRVLTARWLGLDAEDGRLFALSPASVSTLDWEREQRVIASWNLT